MEEEDATEEAEEVGGEQREVDSGGAGHLHHDGHEAVQSEHAQNVDGKQHGCKTRGFYFKGAWKAARWRS